MKRYDLAEYPVPTLGGGYSEAPDGTRTSSYSTRCEDCKHGFTATDPKNAQTMWWEHLRDHHPNAWAALRDDAPDLSHATEFEYLR